MSTVFLTNDLAEAFQGIVDTFSGTDGGVRFVRFRALLEELERQSIDGDKSSEEILKLVKRFKKLIDVANEQREPN